MSALQIRSELRAFLGDQLPAQAAESDLAFLAVQAGVLSEPQLLARTVIELPDECEYLIDRDTVSDLTLGLSTVRLSRLIDQKILPVTREDFERYLERSPVFDQLSAG